MQEVDLFFERAPADSVMHWLKGKDIDGHYGKMGFTPLVYAIVFDRSDLVEDMIRAGADLETRCGSKTPLLFALEYNHPAMVRYLVKKGARLDVRDTLDNTPLFYAAGQNNVPMLRFLLRHGVPIGAKNKFKYTAREYSVITNKSKSAKFLKSYFENHLPNYFDGPYVKLENRRMVKIYYLRNDSVKMKSSVLSRTVKTRDTLVHFRGFGMDTMRYTFSRKIMPEPDSFPASPSIFLMGDIHGDYDDMVRLLRKGGVIDSKLNWTWGQGHLVFLGDIFDRGEKVTECLWLIYRLEQQAEKQGGYVHYILGNHEAMILTRDLRYLSEKYFYMNDRLKLTYSVHFDKKSFLGRWIRSKNTVIRIGPYLFTHAGISPVAVKYRYSLSAMNRAARFYFDHQKPKYLNDTILFVLGSDGPLWYRGYYDLVPGNHKINGKELDEVLAFYRAQRIFVGHTNVPKIETAFRGRIIFMDVPYYLGEAKPEALWINNGQFYIIRTDEEGTSELEQPAGK